VQGSFSRRVAGPRGISFGFGGPPPPDVIAILVVLFVTYSMQYFESTAIIPLLLLLTPAVVRGFLWQLATYPFVGFGAQGLWFLLWLLMIFWFGRDVFWRLGRKRFWTTLLVAAVGSALVAVAAQLATDALGGPVSAQPFVIMQGQYTLMTMLVAAFATVYGDATILLFFVLPVKARWFLPLEILFAFMAFLTSKDVAGFAGLCAAVLITYLLLVSGGIGGTFRRFRRRIERFLLERRLARLRRGRDFDVIEGKRDRWVN